MPPIDDPSHAGDGLSIKQASEFLGVPAPTLRSWERRYGLPATSRSVGGHRRYGSEELVQLRLMRDEIALGRRAGGAARWVREFLDDQNPALERINRILAGSRLMDSDMICTALDRARDELGLDVTLDDVLMPAMRQVGAWWETGRCDIGQEHFTTEVVRGWLARMITLAPKPESDRWVLLAVGPRDLHTLGIEALAALLTQGGTGCRLLGPRTPLRVLLTATVASPVAAVVVVSHLPTQRRPAVDSIVAVAETGVPTFYAGNAFLFTSSREGVPGTYLGDTIGGGARLIRDSALG